MAIFPCCFLSCFLTKRDKKREKERKRRRKEGEKKRREENGKKKGQFGSFLVDYAAATYTVQPGLYTNMWHFTIITRK